MLSRESFYGSHRWHNGKTPGRMLKKAVQQGRRRAETGGVPSGGYVEDFDELRTKLAGFFSILQDCGFREWRTRGSAPDDAFLIEEVIDDLDAIPHLDLRFFRHGDDGTDQLA
jgi:hypothetical protein